MTSDDIAFHIHRSYSTLLILVYRNLKQKLVDVVFLFCVLHKKNYVTKLHNFRRCISRPFLSSSSTAHVLLVHETARLLLGNEEVPVGTPPIAYSSSNVKIFQFIQKLKLKGTHANMRTKHNHLICSLLSLH